MKREIEFRGKTAKGEWVYGYYCPCVISSFPSTPCIVRKERLDNGCWTPEEVIPETVGQYTGITDKNGKKVYVGDILQYGRSKGEVVFGEYGGEPHTTMGFFLKVNDALFTCEEDDFYYEGIDSKHEIEVIGNIYENPELLNKIEYKGESNNGD